MLFRSEQFTKNRDESSSLSNSGGRNLPDLVDDDSLVFDKGASALSQSSLMLFSDTGECGGETEEEETVLARDVGFSFVCCSRR